MDKRIMTLLTRTPLHVGAGGSVGIVDQPVMRERHTRIPIIPGSSLKGVLRDCFENGEGDTDAADWLFGTGTDKNAAAGALLIGEARVLAFPVRSVKCGFAWITCPLVLRRYQRDTDAEYDVPSVAGETCLAVEALTVVNGQVIFEDYCLERSSDVPKQIVEAMKSACSDQVWAEVESRLAVVSDEVFSHFAENACDIVNRVRIDDETGTVATGGLFNQENVPSETLFYTVIGAQTEKRAKKKDEDVGSGKAPRSANEALDKLGQKIAELGVLQVGGDETLGLGYCSVELREVGKE